MVAPIGDRVFNQNDVVSIDASLALDAIDGDVLTYTATGKASLTLDLNTGVISGMLTNNDATNGPDDTVAITADDGKQHAGNSRLTKIWPTAIT